MKFPLTRFAPQLLSVMRIMIGLLYLQHGTTKFLDLPHTQMSGVSVASIPGVAGLFELIGSVLIVLGLFTQPVAFLLSGEMAVAYFLAHAPHSFFPLINMGELAVVYCFTFLFLAAAGGGPWSLDALRTKRT